MISTTLRSLVLAALLASPAMAQTKLNIRDFGARPNDGVLDTEAIQQAIDEASDRAGNGANVYVIIPSGTFHTGALHLKSRVTLQLYRRAVLRGSDRWQDYAAPGDSNGDWQDALISAEGRFNPRIVGGGVIDGVNAQRPTGEEGFRGPHAVRIVNCQNATVKGIEIRNAGNYAVFSYGTTNLKLIRTRIRGGHDGLHAQNCDHITIDRCNLQTGDDCVAGTDNTNALITDSDFNSSTNGFRFGCWGLEMERCGITGPGNYPHQITGNRATQAAFVHFAPVDRNPQLGSDQWQIRDLTVSGVRDLFYYDYHNGLWQQGQPMHALTIDGIVADVGEGGVFVRPHSNFFMKLINGSITSASSSSKPVIDVNNYRWVVLENLSIDGRSNGPLVRLQGGNRTDITNVEPAGRISVD